MDKKTPAISNILVPLDGSPRAESAIPWALELARHHQANLILFRVGMRPEVWSPLDPATVYLEEQEARCMGYLMEIEASLKPNHEVVISSEYAMGNAAQCILDRATELRDPLIVMNSHGRDGLSRWLLGSVAEKVSRHAVCPVFLCRHTD